MSDPGKEPLEAAQRKSLEDLDKRLKKARGETEGPRGPERARGAPASGLGVAWRISIELVVAIGVGAAIGIGLDALFGTKPWLLLVFLFLGFGAGIRNVYRATREMGEAAEREDEADRDR